MIIGPGLEPLMSLHPSQSHTTTRVAGTEIRAHGRTSDWVSKSLYGHRDFRLFLVNLSTKLESPS